MHLLDFTLYGFGQFLQILLWVFLPVFILSLLVTTYLHYRKRIRLAGQQLQTSISPYQYMAESPWQENTDHQPRPAHTPLSSGPEATMSQSHETAIPQPPPADAIVSPVTQEDQPEFIDNPYKGLLWMKNKYEQDRELADIKYEQLRTDFRRSEERMVIMLAEQASLRDLLEKKELRIVFLQGQLDDRQSWIDGQNERSQQEKARYEELVSKLEFSSQLLLKIHKELDISKGLGAIPGELNTMIPGELNFPAGEGYTIPRERNTSPGIPAGADIPTGKDASINDERTEEVRPLPETKIVSWIESGSA